MEGGALMAHLQHMYAKGAAGLLSKPAQVWDIMWQLNFSSSSEQECAFQLAKYKLHLKPEHEKLTKNDLWQRDK